MGIRVPPDSTGQTVETNSPDGTTQRQVVTVGDKTTAANTLAVDASGRVSVNVNGTATTRPTDGTNPITQTFDLDSGAGADWQLGVSLRKSASGGSVEAGTSTNPLRTDPTGTTIQPVSGTVTAGVSNLPATVDTNSGVKSASTLRVVLATDQPALTNKLLVTPDSVALPANQSVNVSQINGVTPLMGNGVTGTGSQRVTIASDNTAFSVNAAQSGTWTVQPGNTANTTPWLTAQAPATSGGLSISHLVTAATTNAANIKASAGQVFGWSIYNNAAYPIYVKFHNTAGTPTAGAGVVHSVGVQAGTGRDWNTDIGIAFSTGIGITVVKDITDAGTTAVALSDAIVEVYYK
jgi:hypothetical protein